MEMIVMLDTNAYADWRREGKWHENLALADRVFLPAIVLGELDFGFRKGARLDENRKGLEDFLSQAQVGIWKVGLREARIYGELIFYLRKQGTPLPQNDVWIAACVLAGGGELLTSDGHFEKLPQVRVGVQG